MAPQEPSVNLKEVISTKDYSDVAIESAKSHEKRHSTHSHSFTDSDDTESTDDDVSIHNIYNDAESLAEIKSITRIDSRAISRFATGISVATTTDPNFEVDFEDGDPRDPHNWPFWYRCVVIFFVSYSTLTV
jgi:hypothetical protein